MIYPRPLNRHWLIILSHPVLSYSVLVCSQVEAPKAAEPVKAEAPKVRQHLYLDIMSATNLVSLLTFFDLLLVLGGLCTFWLVLDRISRQVVASRLVW